MANGNPIRYHSMDALRAVAMLLGIYLHCAIPWAGLDDQAAKAAAVNIPGILGQVIHLFRMQAFFLVAGFFARFLFHRDGWAKMMRNRSARILAPFAVGCVVLLPMTHVMFVFAAVRGRDPNAPFSLEPFWLYVQSGKMWEYFTPNYLWFLSYLMMMYALALVGRSLLMRVNSNGMAHRVGDWLIRAACQRWHGFMIWGAMSAAVMLAFRTPIVDMVPFYFHPLFGPFGLYFLFFMAGWLLHRNPDLLQCLKVRWRYHLLIPIAIVAVAALCAVPVVMMSGEAEVEFFSEFAGQFESFKALMSSGNRFDESGVARVPFMEMILNFSLPETIPTTVLIGVALYVIAVTQIMWTLSLFMVGFFARYFDAQSAGFRYIADSSYWLYLAHGPVVMYAQIEWAYWDIPWLLKNTLLNAYVISILLVSYHLLVRSTVIGQFLNGRKYPFRWPWQTVSPNVAQSK